MRTHAGTFLRSTGELVARSTYREGDALESNETHVRLLVPGDVPMAELWFDGSDVMRRQPSPGEGFVWSASALSWQLPLSAAVDTKVSEINAWRDAREYAPFAWSGHLFDATPDALRRLSVAAALARDVLAAGSTRTVTWTLADNTTIDLSAADVLSVLAAYGEAMGAAHATARALKVAARAAQTPEQVLAIELPLP